MPDTPIEEASYIPVPQATPCVSFRPLIMPVAGRRVDLNLRVAFPSSGDGLPVILLSHGHGPSTYLSSSRGYEPLVEFYASHGFVVLQPTHQDSKALGLDPTGPEGALFWRSRATDMRFILDNLGSLKAAVPGLGGRVDETRIGGVGHSMGGHTIAMLGGMRVSDPVDGMPVDLSDGRMKAGVLLAPPGDGADLAAFATEHYPVLGRNDFGGMTAPMLVVAGDLDWNPDFSERDDWRADAYALGPSPKCLLTLSGAKHSQGGVSGYDVKEAVDQDPELLGIVQRLSWAYLRSALYPDDPSWETARAGLAERGKPRGRIECK